jgi:predicted nucleotidyltransferase
MHPIVQQIAQEYKTQLIQLYGSGLDSLILFGSYARGDYNNDSDVDFAIILKDPRARTSAEIFKTSPITASLGLKYGLVLSNFPTTKIKLETSLQGIYQSIRREGIRI